MLTDIIWLVSEAPDATNPVTEAGDVNWKETQRWVYADAPSVGQSEFYQAAAVGLKPELKFVLQDYLDYGGEKRIRYAPFGSDTFREYEVLRTYRNGNRLELTVTATVNNPAVEDPDTPTPEPTPTPTPDPEPTPEPTPDPEEE